MTVPLMLLIATRLMMSGANRLKLKVGSGLVPHPMAHQGPTIHTHANFPRLFMQFDPTSVGDRRQVGICHILEHEKVTMWLCNEEDVCQETRQMILCTQPSPEMTCVLQEDLFIEGKPVWACAPPLSDKYGSPVESAFEESKQGGPAELADCDPEATRDGDPDGCVTNPEDEQGGASAATRSPVKMASLRHIEPASNKRDAASWWQGDQ